MADVVQISPEPLIEVYLVSCVRQHCRRSHVFENGRTPDEAMAILAAAGWRRLPDPFTEASIENGDPEPLRPLPPHECPDHDGGPP